MNRQCRPIQDVGMPFFRRINSLLTGFFILKNDYHLLHRQIFSSAVRPPPPASANIPAAPVSICNQTSADEVHRIVVSAISEEDAIQAKSCRAAIENLPELDSEDETKAKDIPKLKLMITGANPSFSDSLMPFIDMDLERRDARQLSRLQSEIRVPVITLSVISVESKRSGLEKTIVP